MNSLRIEGQKTVGVEITQQLGWQVPDWIILPSGNLGNVSALAKGLDLAYRLGVIDRRPRLVAAQAERANPLYQAFQNGFQTYQPVTAGPTAASAIRIGDPVSYDKAVRALQACDGVVEQASENELAEAVALADGAGLYACPAHRSGVGRGAEAGPARDHPAGRTRGGHFYGPRAKVYGFQD